MKESALDMVRRREIEAEENRLAMPEVSRWVNLHDAKFGKSRVRYASERGIVKGKRPAFIEVRADQMVLFVDGKLVTWGGNDEPEIQKHAGADFSKLSRQRKNAIGKRSSLP